MHSQERQQPPAARSQKVWVSSGNFWGPPWRAGGGGARVQGAAEAPVSRQGLEKGAPRPRRASGTRQPTKPRGR